MNANLGHSVETLSRPCFSLIGLGQTERVSFNNETQWTGEARVKHTYAFGCVVFSADLQGTWCPNLL